MTQNIYQQLGLKQVINACGKMTILGVSSVAPEVMQATARAASSFVEIDQLVDKTGELVLALPGRRIATLPPVPQQGSPSLSPPPLHAATRPGWRSCRIAPAWPMKW